MINGQKPYGKDYSVSDTFAYYKLKLDGRYTAQEILAAIDTYTDLKNDIPAPADLIQIINPPEAKITYAEYKHALEQHAAEGYPPFGYHGQIIKDYKRQQGDDAGVKTYHQILEARQAGQPALSPEIKKILAANLGE